MKNLNVQPHSAKIMREKVQLFTKDSVPEFKTTQGGIIGFKIERISKDVIFVYDTALIRKGYYDFNSKKWYYYDENGNPKRVGMQNAFKWCYILELKKLFENGN